MSILRQALTFSCRLGSEPVVIFLLGGVLGRKVVPLALRNHTFSSLFSLTFVPTSWDLTFHFSTFSLNGILPPCLPTPPLSRLSSLSFPYHPPTRLHLPPTPPPFSPRSCSPKCEVMIVAMATKTRSQSGFVLIRPSLPRPCLFSHSPLSAWAKCNDNK